MPCSIPDINEYTNNSAWCDLHAFGKNTKGSIECMKDTLEMEVHVKVQVLYRAHAETTIC